MEYQKKDVWDLDIEKEWNKLKGNILLKKLGYKE